MSEVVEQRILALLGHPTMSPFGTPIPGLDRLGSGGAAEDELEGLEPVSSFGDEYSAWVTIRRFEEPIQNNVALMERLKRAGALPGETVKVRRSEGGGVLVGNAGEYAELDRATASHVLVRPAKDPTPA
jgi:DtxR family Mn-dependent transcriptional regulator